MRSAKTRFGSRHWWRLFSEPRVFAERIKSLRKTDWVVYAKPPFGGPRGRSLPISPATRIARRSPTQGS